MIKQAKQNVQKKNQFITTRYDDTESDNVCSTLGLETCQCEPHENSVLKCDNKIQYCQRDGTQCTKVNKWASKVFQEIQVKNKEVSNKFLDTLNC